MKALLDTNIIIHRESIKVLNEDIGYLFKWLDKLRIVKYIHPLTVIEINKYKNTEIVESLNIKLESYNELKTQSPFEGKIVDISHNIDTNENDIIDSHILNEVYSGRIDILISEDKKVHTKAKLLDISEKVFTINSFLEKVTAENPDLVDYKVLSVKKQYFGEIDLKSSFFDSFREDYKGFENWFKSKSDEISYVCYQDNQLSAFLYLKVEGEEDNYNDIFPVFSKKKRLKIGTFKVSSNGYKIGERFLKIIFDNALKQKVSEIYVTIFSNRPEQKSLISLLETWGFQMYGHKNTNSGTELVYIKEFSRDKVVVNIEDPKLTFPYLSRESDIYITPIYQKYHTELFPDSILKTESPKDFVENEPYRNALSKVYISRSKERNLKSGDLIVFYRTGDKGNALHTGVVTTIGVVENVIINIPDEETFIYLCRKRSVFTDQELREYWNFNPNNKPEHLIKRPFIVNFLYSYSLPKRPNLKWLNETGVIPNIMEMPRGFRKISREHFNKIIKYSKQ
ncbi:MAG: PIN domain-containing protein [Bacteroidales bacterium]|nr:PIN domain-containing protein [Bacteroidales bacterium]